MFWGIPLTSCFLECRVQIFIKYWIALNVLKYSHIHFCQPQAVYGRVQPRHSNLSCATWPCRPGLSIYNKPLKIHPTGKQILSNIFWYTSKATLSGIFNSGDKPQCPSARSLHAKSEKPFIFIKSIVGSNQFPFSSLTFFQRMELKFHNSKGSKESNGTRETNGIGAGTNGINGTNGTNGVNWNVRRKAETWCNQSMYTIVKSTISNNVDDICNVIFQYSQVICDFITHARQCVHSSYKNKMSELTLWFFWGRKQQMQKYACCVTNAEI